MRTVARADERYVRGAQPKCGRRIQPDMNRPELTIVLVAFNEAACIEAVVRDTARTLNSHLHVTWELLVVDNGSTDDTYQIALKMKAEIENISIVHVRENTGYGGGVIAGLRSAQGKIVGYMGADGQVSPSTIVQVFKKIHGTTMCLGKARRVIRCDGGIRKFLSMGYNAVARTLLGLETWDVNGVPKLMTRDVLEGLVLRDHGWFIDTEVMVKSCRLGARIVEVPVEFRERETGCSKVKATIMVTLLCDLVKFAFSRRQRWNNQE
jgi:dolichol-phosphate mannosyltransferase